MVEKEKMHSDSKGIKNLRSNPWIISTVVLGVLALILIAILAGRGIGSAGVSEKKAGESLIQFINSQGRGNATIVDSTKEGSLYKITVEYNGENIPVYVSMDGKYLITQPLPLSNDVVPSDNAPTEQRDVPKSDKPTVELFVMSYCPFGTQAEKGLVPVLNLMKNKINGTIRFVHYTMHGEKEDTENFRQICIREEQGSKFNSYLSCILNSTDSSNPADVNACMQKTGVDSTKVNDCITKRAAGYYSVDKALSQGYGVQGSPTLIINGVESSAGRDSASYLSAICSAFNVAPSECATQLSSASPSPGFGLGTSDSANLAQCG
jgi:protein-disulfide isomerase